MPMKNAAGGCGCCDCELFSDTFGREPHTTTLLGNWSEVAGDWMLRDGYLVTNDANALAIVTSPATTNDRQVVKVRMRGDDGDELRVIIGYLDQDNYHYAQVVVASGCTTFTIWQVAAGVVTQLALAYAASRRISESSMSMSQSTLSSLSSSSVSTSSQSSPSSISSSSLSESISSVSSLSSSSASSQSGSLWSGFGPDSEWHKVSLSYDGDILRASFYIIGSISVSGLCVFCVSRSTKRELAVTTAMAGFQCGLATGVNSGRSAFDIFSWAIDDNQAFPADLDPSDAALPCRPMWDCLLGWDNFGQDEPSCEWTTTGSVTWTGSGLRLAGFATATYRNTHPEGSAYGSVRCAFTYGDSAVGERIRLTYGGQWGELEIGLTDDTLRVSDGTELRRTKPFVDGELAVLDVYHNIVCFQVGPDGVSGHGMPNDGVAALSHFGGVDTSAVFTNFRFYRLLSSERLTCPRACATPCQYCVGSPPTEITLEFTGYESTFWGASYNASFSVPLTHLTSGQGYPTHQCCGFITAGGRTVAVRVSRTPSLPEEESGASSSSSLSSVSSLSSSTSSQSSTTMESSASSASLSSVSSSSSSASQPTSLYALFEIFYLLVGSVAYYWIAIPIPVVCGTIDHTVQWQLSDIFDIPGFDLLSPCRLMSAGSGIAITTDGISGTYVRLIA